MGGTLLDKVWDAHTVRTLPSGETQLLIGMHLIHEVTSVQAFSMLAGANWPVRMPHRTWATIDHVIPTQTQIRPFPDALAEQMAEHLDQNTKTGGIAYFGLNSGRQGIVHVIGPELGLSQPGMTIACGDSHTSTHGALGSIAFGIGTSQVRDVLATQCLRMSKPKIRQVNINGRCSQGVYAKDIALAIINQLGADAGAGYAYEYNGSLVHGMTIEERLTLCNMSIEGGARFGYVNPDDTTFQYLVNKPFAPKGGDFERAVCWWKSIATGKNASFDDRVTMDAGNIHPFVTWGINPGQSVAINDVIPRVASSSDAQAVTHKEALAFMGFTAGDPIKGTEIDVAFIGSCTNSRLSDLKVAADIIRGRKVHPRVRALVVPGSQEVAAAAEAEGLHEVFQSAGFDWRKPGCSMCVAINGDTLQGREICASSSNRNFIGRQGSPRGRTLLMSPAMVAAAAIEGALVDVREYF